MYVCMYVCVCVCVCVCVYTLYNIYIIYGNLYMLFNYMNYHLHMLGEPLRSRNPATPSDSTGGGAIRLGFSFQGLEFSVRV